MSHSVINPEPMPVKNNNPAMWDLVIEDIKKRDEFGLKKYNTRLQGFNGRNSIVDFYQELLDAVVYSRQWLYEFDKIVEVLKFYASQENGTKAQNILDSLNVTETTGLNR